MSRIARSLLFVPGDRPERFEKAIASGAHEIVLDLEDAVAEDRKREARDAIANWLSSRPNATVRINAADSLWFEEDIKMIGEHPGLAVMLPKADLETTREVSNRLDDRPITALIETVRGVCELRELLALRGVERAAFGSLDFSVESGIEDKGDALTPVRIQIVMESRYAGIMPPVDGVSLELKDTDRITTDTLRSRSLGYGGKLCIHPKQVVPVNETFLPTSVEREWATKVMAAIESSGGGATSVDGKMVDKPVIEQARRILAEHGTRI